MNATLENNELVTRMRQRARIVDGIRAFFRGAGFLEVDTPVAIRAPAPEVHIEAPVVTLHAPGPLERFLQPSPELPMKRLLGAGFPNIFQIAVVFRDDELGPLHRPEFRLIEWYRRGSSWTELLDDCEGLLRAAAKAAGLPLRFSSRGRFIDLSQPFRRITVEEAFVTHAGFSLLENLDRERLRTQVQRLGIPCGADDSFDDLYHRVFLNCVEAPLLQDESPLFLTDYPAPLAALARLSPQDPRVAERFELFAGGLELGNGFGELLDPQEQTARFTRDRERRRQLGMRDYPIDQDFLDVLPEIPPSAGIAVGLERLLMLVMDAPTIDDVSYFAWEQV